MRKFTLRQLLFLALSCDLGLFSKQLIAPAANLLTDALRIPGGVGTSFSLMFLTLAASLTPHPLSGTLAGFVQGLTALVIGRIGSMGIFTPLAYIVPGLVVDAVLYFTRRLSSASERLAIANAAASAAASLTANLLVFRLDGSALLLYLSVSVTTGSVCGVAAGRISSLLKPILSNHGGKSE